MNLVKHVVITGIIRCRSGVRVGGMKETIEIGAVDNPIIRNPITNHPYLPGSSIKGKMRSLLELTLPTSPIKLDGLASPVLAREEKKRKKGENWEVYKIELHPCTCGACVVCKLFGCGSTDKSREPSRLIFRDALLTSEWARVLGEAARERGIFFAEVKPGVQIDRKGGGVAEGRFFNYERVPGGTEFEFQCVIRVFSHGKGDRPVSPPDFVIDDEKDLPVFKRVFALGLRLLETEGVGGKMTPGSGNIALGSYLRKAEGEAEEFFEGKLLWDREPWDFRAEP